MPGRESPRVVAHTPGGFVGKLAGTFVSLVVVLGGTAVLSIRQLDRSANERETVALEYLKDVVYAERLRSAQDAEAAAARGYLITRSPEFFQRFEVEQIAFEGALRDLRSRVYSHAGRELLDDVARAAADYKEANDGILVEQRSGADPEDVKLRFERVVAPKRRHLSRAIDELVAHKERRLEGGYEEARSLTSRAVATSTTVLALAVLASGGFAWLMGLHLARAHRREGAALRSAEQAIAARDQLVGIVAHDLRSPLSAITLKAAILRKTTGEDKTRKHAEAIENVSTRMENLIKSLLDAASIESGWFSVDQSQNEVEDIFSQTMETLGSLASPKSIRLEYHLKQADLTVMADRDRVIQVLTNLIGNAVKFTFEGGRVDVTAELVGSDVRFSVSDTGPGIAPAHLPQVFQRFWKAETGGKKGTGLGLYIAKGIVEAHGGRIWVESQLGHGANFHFTIPVSGSRPSSTGHDPDRPSTSPPPAGAETDG